MLKQSAKIIINPELKKELYRKSLHLSSLWMPFFILIASSSFAVLIFNLIFLANLIVEYGNYKRYPWARQIFGIIFFRLMRQKESSHSYFQISGSLYVLLAAIICTMSFSRNIAAISMIIMLVSDTAAAIIGKLYGRHKIYKNKTLEGSTAFFVSGLIINMLCAPIYPFTYIGVIACAVATLSEIFEDKLCLDDNLSIPIVIGAILTALGR